MQHAAKRKTPLPASLAAVRLWLLLVVACGGLETRVWSFAPAPQRASGQVAFATPAFIGENYDAVAYDASDSLVAAKNGTVVIGENMARVEGYASRIGAETFQGTGMEANRLWIQEARSAGKQVIDIGPDFARRAQRVEQGIRPDSIFYNMERMETTGYENYLKIFERTGKYSGGVP
jgi:hypothetical protein